MNKPTHFDLFSGIGGFALAAENAGWETIGFSEVDFFCEKVLKKHWPNVKNYGDIKKIKCVKADLITGGFPCQPFSLAGKQKGRPIQDTFGLKCYGLSPRHVLPGSYVKMCLDLFPMDLTGFSQIWKTFNT